MSELKHLKSKAEFDEVISSDKPTLVDFFATWCGPCQILGMIIEELKDNTKYENADKVNVVKVDIDEVEELAKEFEIMSVPTMMIYKSGELVERMSGIKTVDELKGKLDSLLRD